MFWPLRFTGLGALWFFGLGLMALVVLGSFHEFRALAVGLRVQGLGLSLGDQTKGLELQCGP